MKQFILEFWWFGLKQAYACLFGGLLLATIVATYLLWPENAALARYDFLFIAAIAIQAGLIAFKLEQPEELKVIFIFHLVGTLMEIFKTHVGSWSYPEENLIRIAGVPLFSGFMYSAVGSYIARAWRIFDFRFVQYPRKEWTLLLCILIYINFFSHHYIWDLRYGLFAMTLWLYGGTRIFYRPYGVYRWMPLLLGFVLVSFFIWIAENLGTFAAAWVYPNQREGWRIVSFSKMGSWFLLMIISFVLVTLVKPVLVYRADLDGRASK
jgi:uncharacterized membrane protein YoaT (DUF817 family)